jgi:leucyl-tRNA synthetase
MKEAIGVAIDKIIDLGIGIKKVNYKMRDAGFSRQRYWGEPFPIIWNNGIAYPMDEKDLPLELPHVEKYGPGPEGEGPLANVEDWVNLPDGSKRETSTMPGYAGSSWYFLRYMDPHNNETFCDKTISDYWGQVDLYVGGTEHAVGHLLYSRMWTKVLFDLGLISFDEPFKKLVNQGMITGKSYFFNSDSELVITSYNKSKPGIIFTRFKYGHQFVDANGKLTKKIFEESGSDITNEIIWDKDEDGEYVFLKEESEKMSKSKFNVDNPDDIVEKYGADTFRMYEMFLGPIEQSKPWDTKGIEGVHRFLRKLWRLFNDEIKGKVWTEERATEAEMKVLHKTIKKINGDTEHFSFNTAVSAFMVAVNELTDLKCHKKEVLEKLLILLVPYAPHISEELWHQLGNSSSILDAAYPEHDEKYLVESSKEYPVSINGKLRTTINITLDAEQPEVEKIVTSNDVVLKWLEGKQPKKIIFVKGKMINVVI